MSAAESKKRYRPRPGERVVKSPEDLINVQEVLTLTGWSIDTLNRRVANGEYPQPIVGGKSRSDRKWARKQHTRWVDAKVADVAKIA